ncbi:MAG: hypothetical protein AAF664_23840 [Planctomycetota bacterium]
MKSTQFFSLSLAALFCVASFGCGGHDGGTVEVPEVQEDEAAIQAQRDAEYEAEMNAYAAEMEASQGGN